MGSLQLVKQVRCACMLSHLTECRKGCETGGGTVIDICTRRRKKALRPQTGGCSCLTQEKKDKECRYFFMRKVSRLKEICWLAIKGPGMTKESKRGKTIANIQGGGNCERAGGRS